MLASERALIAQARGEARAALDLANQAVAIAEASLKEHGSGSRNLPPFLVDRSDIQLQLGDVEKAAADARRALKMWLDEAQPGTFSSKPGRAYLTLGRSLQAQDKREEARAAFRPAVETSAERPRPGA